MSTTLPWIAAQIGESKSGKTADMLFTLNDGGYYFGRPASFRPSHRLLGWSPDTSQIDDAQDLEAMLEALKRRFGNGPKPHPKTGIVPRGVGVDDISIAAETTKAKMEKRYSGWDLWAAIRTAVLNLLRFCNDVGLGTVISGHPKPGDKGEKGGMKFPTKELVRELPKHCDIVLLVEEDLIRAPHPYSYRCGPQGAPGWVTGDRNHVCPPTAPLNLAEILRASDRSVDTPFRIPRLAPMEVPNWCFLGSAEDTVTKMTAKIIDRDAQGEEQALSTLGRRLLADKIPQPQIAWVLRDIRDRLEIERANQNRLLNDFGLNLFGS